MLPKIKRSLFKLLTQEFDELNLNENNNDGKPSLEFSAISGCLWMFRYDCIVSV